MKLPNINLNEAYADTQHSGHRRPREAGSADRYYGRPCSPNFSYCGQLIEEHDMTAAQKREYIEAWEKETDRKNWG